MNYKTLNNMGTALEVLGAVGVAISAQYDLPLIPSFMAGSLFIYGSHLRDRAIVDANDEGKMQALFIRRQISGDLGDELSEDVPFIP